MPRQLDALLTITTLEHLHYGSDYPFTLGDPDPVKTLSGARVDAKTLQGFFRDNALRFLGC